METVTISKSIMLKLGKVPGKDNITPEMIKHIGKAGISNLLELINDVVNNANILKEWKTDILPIYKKGDKINCHNYRGITFSSVSGKVFARIIEKRVRNKIETTLEDTQRGFRKNRSTQDLIFIIRQASEKLINKDREILIRFIDLEKGFDRIRREDIWKVLRKIRVNKNSIEVIKDVYKGNTNMVRINNEEFKEFETREASNRDAY